MGVELIILPIVRSTNLYRYGLFSVLLVGLGLFLIWPIALTVRGGFIDPKGALTFRYIASVFEDPLLVRGLFNALLVAAVTTILCFIMTMPMSLLAARYDFPGKVVVSSLVLIPLILPPFVGAIGLRAILGRMGALNSLLGFDGAGIDFLGGAIGGRFTGVVLMEALHLYPIMYLNITAALANLDPSLDEAALNLGASRWARFRRCTLPLILPGVFAGATIVFIWSFTELGTPLMFDFYTITPVQVFFGISEISDNPRPYALVVVMLTVAVGLYLLGKLAFGGRAYAMYSKASIKTQMIRLGPLAGLAALGLFVVITVTAILPHVGVVLSSVSVEGQWYHSILPRQWTFSHFEEALSHPLAMGSITNSLLYASAATAICAVVGIAIAYLTVRIKIPGGFVLDTLAMMPLAVPGLVMAFGYVAMTLAWPFGQGDPLEGMFSVLGQNPNPVLLLVVAYAVRRLPYIVRSAVAGLQQTSSQLEEAALNLGASTMTSLRRVVIPLIMANLIAGAILVFSFSMLEVSDSLILAQREDHFPITKAIWEFYNRLGDGPYIASAMGVWGMAILTVTLVGASVLMGSKLGAIFRV